MAETAASDSLRLHIFFQYFEILRIKQGPYRAVHILSFISYLEFSINM